MTDRREYMKKYNEGRKEDRATYRLDNQEHIKEYNAQRYVEKKDDINAKGKLWYNANKERIAAHKAEPVVCDLCGSTVTRHGMAQHKRTLKCQNSCSNH